MEAQARGNTQAPQPARWRPWLPVAAAAVALLLASEALWLWQTWPVRALLKPATATQTVPQ